MDGAVKMLKLLFVGLTVAVAASPAWATHDAVGIDPEKMSFKPGLRIVPLKESIFVGPLAQEFMRGIAEQKQKGFQTVPDEQITDLRRAVSRASIKRYASIADIRPRIHFDPSSLAGTDLATAHLVEATTAGAFKEGRWTGLSRIFDAAGLGLVVFDESDYVAAEGSITLIEELVNVEVNGHPGSIQTKRSKDGRTLVHLGWCTDRFAFSLMLQPDRPDDIEGNQRALLAIAGKITG